MGLDMYLEGEKYLNTNWNNPELNEKEDGFKVKRKILEIGYWRKHPNLHGFIVQNFAEGVDQCQEINLSKDDLLKIKEAVVNDNLPYTEGFFFGKSGDRKSENAKIREWAEQEYKNTIGILDRAVAWLEDKDEKSYKSVVYRASW